VVRCGFILTEEALFPLSCRLSTSTLPSLPPSHHPDTRKRIEELDYFRGIAILFVVFGHSWQSPHGQIYDLSQAIMVGGTTLFVFISGFFFAKTYASRDGSYREFLGKKILNVGMPFVAVTLVFLGIIFLKLPFTTDTGGGALRRINNFLTFGYIYTSHWYIPFVMLMFLLAPLHRLFFRMKGGGDADARDLGDGDFAFGDAPAESSRLAA